MKKTNETLPRRKLGLGREAITLLTPPQLGHVAGGLPIGERASSYWPPCPPPHD